MSIGERLEEVLREMESAAIAAGRDPGDVALIAVSKRQPAQAIREAYAAGQRDFGENYLQELAAKQGELQDCPDIRWHFIGHLQSRKSRDAVSRGVWVHGVDSLSGVKRLNDAAAAAGVTIPVFLQVNIGGEASKSGAAPGDVDAVAAALAASPNLDWRGLMTIPPAADHADDTRRFFGLLRGMRDTLTQAYPRCRGELSMGMSQDFPIAVAEGATWVRVGTAIFGSRQAP